MSLQEGVQLGRHRARRGHARELRELVDQPFQRFDLADDRRGALLHQILQRRREVAELAAQPLGRQLNRRQRVLDLVRQAPRHFTPRRHLLRADQRRHVVHHQHRAVEAAVGAGDARRRRHDVTLAPVAHQRHFLRKGIHLGARGLVEHLVHRRQVGPREHVDRGTADHIGGDFEQPHRRGIDRADAPAAIDRHHAGRNPLEDRFDVAAAAFALLVLALEIDAGALEPLARLCDTSAAIALKASTIDPNSSLPSCSMRWS